MNKHPSYPPYDAGKVVTFCVVNGLIENLLECCHEMFILNFIVINPTQKLDVFEIIVCVFCATHEIVLRSN